MDRFELRELYDGGKNDKKDDVKAIVNQIEDNEQIFNELHQTFIFYH